LPTEPILEEGCPVDVSAGEAAEIETALEAEALFFAEEYATEAPEGEGEADADIPLIESRKAEIRKAYIEPTLKILILKGAGSISVRSESDIALRFNGRVTTVKPGGFIRFKARSARVGVHMYPVGIATFRGTEYDKAVQYAEKWKRDGYTVRIIKAGSPLVHADGSVADTTVYWVALGSFKKEADAELFRDKMNRRGLSAWVIDESILNPKGNIEMTDGRGAVYAYADSHVALLAEKPLEVRDVPFGDGFWSSGNCENRTYLSPLEIYVNEQGKLAAINLVTLEEYVKGVVPVEIRLTAPDEALKAQAISARTEALAKLGIKHAFDPYDFCASQHCQEFCGLTRRTDRTDAAVDATRGLVLMRDGALVDAVYSANCGGHTEHNENVWSGRPNSALRGISELYSNPQSFDSPVPERQFADWLKLSPKAYCGDPRADGAGHFRWTTRFTPKEMSAAVNQYYRVGSVRDIKALKRGVSGRALKIKVTGTSGSATIYKELEIRRVLGKLKSTMFIIEIKRDSTGAPVSFCFHGGGWGHGVGMCQAGAEGMALQGLTHSAILKHYFTGAEIVKLYD
jgi:SpoIID/LytB domain protein